MPTLRLAVPAPWLAALVAIAAAAAPAAAAAVACTSTATLRLDGAARPSTPDAAAAAVEVELREGARPGSRVVARGTLGDDGRLVVSDVCPGRYFFAFARAGEAAATVTRTFDVHEDEDTASDVVITVNRVQAGGPGSRITLARRGEL